MPVRVGEKIGVPWREGTEAPPGMRCDSLGCVQEIDGQIIAFVQDARALPEDCAGADLVVSLVSVRGRCEFPHTVIDRFDLWHNGAHAIWLEGGGALIVIAHNSGQAPLNAHPARAEYSRLVGLVGGLKGNRFTLAPKPLERDFRFVHQGNDNGAVFG